MTSTTAPLALLTGGAGFIGSHTADALLARGYRVRILDCLDPQVHGTTDRFPEYLDARIECQRGDVRDPAAVVRALDGASVVYHFASLTGVGQSMYEMQRYTDVNVSGTACLLEAIVRDRLPVQRVVLSSSRAVYGEGTHACARCGVVYPLPRGRTDLEQRRFQVYCPTCGAATAAVPTVEDRPLRPGSVYGWTKKMQEDLCRHAAEVHGVPVVILRYFNVYGSRQSLSNPYTGIVSIFFSRLRAGQPVALYEHGEPGRDFVHVRDVVQANLLALSADVAPGTTCNVGTGVESTIRDLADALAAAVGGEPAYVDRGEYRVGDIRSCFADLATTAAALGYAPTTMLAEGMREFAAWASGEDATDLYDRMVGELAARGLFGRPAGTAAPPGGAA